MWRGHLRVGGVVTAAILPEHRGNRFSAPGSLFPQQSLGGKERKRRESGLILCHVVSTGFAYIFFKEA